MARTAIVTTTKLDLGPAMLALNDRQRAFVVSLNNAGGKNATEAARAAGYADHNNGAIMVTAHRLLHDPKVQEAIREDCRARLTGDLPQTLDLIDAIAENTQHPHQLKALILKLHQGGLVERTEHKVDVTVTTQTYDQKVDRLIRLSEAAGEDPDAVLKRLGIERPTVIDVEHEEVFDGDIPGLEGLV